MPRVIQHEAFILKTYDVGDADRFCILLTEDAGRLTVCAKGVRKPRSRWSGAIQSFQHVRMELSEHSSGYYLRSAQCIHTFDLLRRDVDRFSLASTGADVLLRLLHDTEPSTSIFRLTSEYFHAVHDAPSSLLLRTFQLSLLGEMGLAPSFHDGNHGLIHQDHLTDSLRVYLMSDEAMHLRSLYSLSANDQRTVAILCDRLLTEHLRTPLRSSSVVV